ncbi:MAG: DUF192 domain-containing protein [bacterium]
MFYLESSSSIRPYRVELTVCRSFVDRLTGALIQGEVPFREGLVFPNCRSVHTFFMRSSIALLMFDQDGEVLEYREKVKPFRMVQGPTGTEAILELAPHRLDEVDSDSDNLRISFPPEKANLAGYPDLRHDV